MERSALVPPAGSSWVAKQPNRASASRSGRHLTDAVRRAGALALLAVVPALASACGGDETFGATSTTAGPSSESGGAGGAGHGGAGHGGAGEGGTAAGGAGGGSSSATITTFLGDLQTNLPFVAFREGEGPWSMVDGLAGTYSVVHGATGYGVAYACVGPDATQVLVQYAGPSDPLPTTLGCPSTVTHTLSGTLSSLAGSWQASVAAGPTGGLATSQNPSYSFAVPEGDHDVVVAAMSPAPLAEVFMRKAKVSVYADVDLDFDASLGATPANAWQGSVTNAAAADFSAACWLWSNLGTSGGWSVGGSTFHCMADAGLELNDVHVIHGAVIDDTSGLLRWHRIYTRIASDQVFTMPELNQPLDGSPIVLATSPAMRVAFDVPSIAGAAEYSLTVGDPSFSWKIDATVGWAEKAGGAHLEMPDFGVLPGWDPGLNVKPAGAVGWAVSVTATSRPVADLLPTWPIRPTPEIDGQWEKSAVIGGSIQP